MCYFRSYCNILLPSCGYRQNIQLCLRFHKLLTYCSGFTVFSLGCCLNQTDVIIPTISGDGTVFSAITCGFSKYLAWGEYKNNGQ